MKISRTRILPQGAPRGFLVYWILHRISRSPTHGYELLREIEEKSQGSWRPGPGSVYPLLRRLVAQGYLKVDKARGERADQKTYRITRTGMDHVRETKEMFKTVNRRLGSFVSMFVDLVEPSDVHSFLIDGSRRHFDIIKNVVEKNRSQLSPEEIGYMLREYSLMLEGQQAWVSKLLAQARTDLRERT